MQSGVRLKRSAFLLDLLALCGAIGIVIGGLIVRDRMPIIPLADGDTWGYLYPELSWLSGLGFQQTYGRDWLYPALLAGILNVSGDFSAITYVQRFLGLGGIFVFWLTCRLWFRLLPAQKPLLWCVCLVLTLALLALYALSSQQALLENTIRPEGILAFFEMAYLYCLVSFFLARWKLRLTGSAIVFGAATLGLSYAVWLLKPSWSLSLVFTVLCLAFGAFGRARPLMRFGPLLSGAVAFVLLFVLPHLFRFQKDAQLFFPLSLVSIHAPQILETQPILVSAGAHNPGVADAIFYEELGKAYRPFLREAELSPRMQRIYQSYIQSVKRAEGKASRPLGFRFLARFAHYLTWTILPLQVAFFAAMIAVYSSRKGQALRLGGLVACAVLGATYGIVLAIAIGHSLDVGRYRISYAPGFLLGLVLITNYLLIFGLGTRIPDKQASKTS
jgi:hypothetical protein